MYYDEKQKLQEYIALMYSEHVYGRDGRRSKSLGGTTI